MPSMPASSAASASSTCWMPLSTIGPSQCARRRGEPVPASGGAGERSAAGSDRCGEVVLGRPGQRRRETPGRRTGSRCRHRAGTAGTPRSRSLRPPAQRPGVERDDERPRSRPRAPASEQADRDVVVVRPVQLVPARPVPRRGSATSSMVCDDAVESTIGTPSSAAARAMASSPVRVQDRLHADRARAAPAPASPCRAASSTSRVWWCPRSIRGTIRVPVERRPVGPHRRPGAGPARDVAERLLREHRAGGVLQAVGVGGQVRPHAIEPAQVYLGAVGTEGGRCHGHILDVRRWQRDGFEPPSERLRWRVTQRRLRLRCGHVPPRLCRHVGMSISRDGKQRQLSIR